MLFQGIQARSWELEQREFGGILTESECIDFLDALVLAVPLVSDSVNFRKSLVLFRKWKSISYSRFRRVYMKNVDGKARHSEDIVDDVVREKLNCFLKVRASARDKSKVVNILRFNRAVDPISDTETSFGLKGASNEYKQLISLVVDDAERLYKKGELGASSRIFRRFLDYMHEKSHGHKFRLDVTEIFFLAWVLHGLGNICYSYQRYKQAYEYYACSLNLKREVNRIADNNASMRLSLFSTKIKVAATRLAYERLSEVEYQKELIKLLRKFEREKKELAKVNSIWVTGQETYLNYLIGKSFLYTNNRQEASSYLRMSMRLAEKSGAYPAYVRAWVFLYAYRADQGEMEQGELDKISCFIREQVRAHPSIRALLSDALQYELLVQSRERERNIRDLVVACGVEQLDLEEDAA